MLMEIYKNIKLIKYFQASKISMLWIKNAQGGGRRESGKRTKHIHSNSKTTNKLNYNYLIQAKKKIKTSYIYVKKCERSKL